MEVIGRIIGIGIGKNGNKSGKDGSGENTDTNTNTRTESKSKSKSKSKSRTRISGLIREWFIRRGWRLSNSRRVVFKNAPLYGVKDEAVDVKVFVSVEDGSAWCRYYGPNYTKEELRKLRDGSGTKNKSKSKSKSL